MAKKELYSLRTQPPERDIERWECVKVDLDFNPTGTYNLSRSGVHLFCSCFAGNKPTCRHRQMIAEFELEDRFNTHWFYHFDAKPDKRWVEGPKHDS